MIRLHLVANALLLWLGYYWLGVGESSIPRLIGSAALAAAILCAALVVHGAAWTWEKPLTGALRRASSHLLPLFLLAVVALALYGLLAWWRGYAGTPAFEFASWLTLKTRKPVKPNTVLTAFNVVLWIFRWVLIPWLLAPLAAAIARDGWRGFRKETWLRPLLYWLSVPVLLVCALWLPLKLLGWTQQFSSFSAEMTSFVIRAAAAYIFFVGGLLALAWATSAGNPRFSHSSTAPSP